MHISPRQQCQTVDDDTRSQRVLIVVVLHHPWTIALAPSFYAVIPNSLISQVHQSAGQRMRMMHVAAHGKVPYACVSQPPRPLARPSIVQGRTLAPLQQRQSPKPAPRKALQVCAAASFSSGPGKAEFPRGEQGSGSDAGSGSETTGLKVATYIFLW